MITPEKDRRNWKENWKMKPFWWDKIHTCHLCGEKDYGSEMYIGVPEIVGKIAICDDCHPEYIFNLCKRI